MSDLLVALPLYRQLDVEVFIRFLNMDKAHVTAVRYVRKMYLSASMMKLTEDSLNAAEPWDRMVVFEADMLPPEDGFERIAQYPDHLDIVGSVYFQHPPPHNPVVYTQSTENPRQFSPLRPNQIDEMMESPGIYPVDGVGMGFTSIHRRVFEKWDKNIPMWGGETFVGHDLWFTWKAREQGFNVNVDTGIECGHITAYPIRYKDHKQAITDLMVTV